LPYISFSAASSKQQNGFTKRKADGFAQPLKWYLGDVVFNAGCRF
jgi:hypothetical protein